MEERGWEEKGKGTWEQRGKWGVTEIIEGKGNGGRGGNGVGRREKVVKEKRKRQDLSGEREPIIIIKGPSGRWHLQTTSPPAPASQLDTHCFIGKELGYCLLIQSSFLKRHGDLYMWKVPDFRNWLWTFRGGGQCAEESVHLIVFVFLVTVLWEWGLHPGSHAMGD